MKNKVVFILGPTAVGKSYIGVNLAKTFNGEIISADSVQIFKDLNIGSAKVTKEEMQGIVHHGIDICQPWEEFSVFDFVEYTRAKIKEIVARGKLPIVVGGTGLYFKALTLGYNFGGVEKDQQLRDRLQQIAQEKGNDALFGILKEKDEKLAEKTDKFNTVRLVRAVEIALSKGNKQTNEVDLDPLVFALTKPRDQLYADINRRVDIMLEKGLLNEVEKLKESGLSEQNQSMHAIGYKELLSYLNGKESFERAVELIKQHSRNYAKRQMTFLRGMECIMVNANEKNVALVEIENRVGEFLK